MKSLNKKYSKKNLESFVYDLFAYLYNTYDYLDERLSNDVLIYSMKKRFYIDEDKCQQKINNIPIVVEDNVDVRDYLEYYNKDTLTLCMESRLNEYLYYYDVEGCKEVAEKVDEIFEKHGFFSDFGTSYILIAMDKNKIKLK